MQLTPQTLEVLAVLLIVHKDKKETYGREICKRTGLESGTVSPMLVRLHGKGLVNRRREQDDGDLGRPLRTYYSLTPAGVEATIKGLLAISPRSTK
jgi:DNA-binding MarR family transcriptional regulator